jgi:transposase
MLNDATSPSRLPVPGSSSAHEGLHSFPAAGFTVREVARRYRVGEDKVRTWIARGELAAVNTAAALCGRPRWVVCPEALRQFERRRNSAPPPKPVRSRRRRQEVDFYPD